MSSVLNFFVENLPILLLFVSNFFLCFVLRSHSSSSVESKKLLSDLDDLLHLFLNKKNDKE